MKVKCTVALIAEVEVDCPDAGYTESILCTEAIMAHREPDACVEALAASLFSSPEYEAVMDACATASIMMAGRGIVSHVYPMMARHGNEAWVPLRDKVGG